MPAQSRFLMKGRDLIARNLANLISLLGVLPVCVLFLDDGYRYIVPLIVFNNIMDDLDGIFAVKLNIKSVFGAALDNVCDAVAHTAFVLMVGMHYGGICGVLGVAAVTAMLIRVVSRIVPGATVGAGSPTNELIRHMFFVLLLARVFSFDVAIVLAAVFTLHTVSMLLPYRMPGLIRSLTKSAFAIGPGQCGSGCGVAGALRCPRRRGSVWIHVLVRICARRLQMVQGGANIHRASLAW